MCATNAASTTGSGMNPFAEGGSLWEVARRQDGRLPGVVDAGGKPVNVIEEFGAPGKKTVMGFIRHFG